MKAIRHGRAWHGRNCFIAADGSIECVSWFSAAIGDSMRVPSKKAGRIGTRRAWKRSHPPRQASALAAFFDGFSS